MGNKFDPIPDNMTIDEASEFWDNHSVADYPSNEVQLEYNSKEHVSFVAISNDLMARLEEKAKQSGISIETLVNLWIQEKLAS
ncbi:MAG: hypothetical protein GY757_36315 [bacterium]|nr:hypothetical protein [bacterium]